MIYEPHEFGSINQELANLGVSGSRIGSIKQEWGSMIDKHSCNGENTLSAAVGSVDFPVRMSIELRFEIPIVYFN